MQKMDSTTIHGIAVAGAALAGVIVTAFGILEKGGSTQAALIALVYGVLHAFLPQTEA